MMASAQVWGIIFILAMNPMIRKREIHGATIVLSVFAGVAVLCLFGFKAEYKRFNAENLRRNVSPVEMGPESEFQPSERIEYYQAEDHKTGIEEGFQ